MTAKIITRHGGVKQNNKLSAPAGDNINIEKIKQRRNKE